MHEFASAEVRGEEVALKRQTKPEVFQERQLL
jgi:hypothetical protein